MELLKKLPKTWQQVSTYQWLEIEKSQKLGLSFFEWQLEIIAIMLNTSVDDEIFYDLTDDEVQTIFHSLHFLLKPLIVSQHPIYEVIPFNRLKLGEFIDIEHYFKDEDEGIPKVVAIMMRRSKKDEWEHKTLEPYAYSIDERAEEILDSPCTQVIPHYLAYCEFRDDFLKKYENLFRSSGDETEEEEELTGRDRILARQEALKEKSQAAFAWESLLWDLSGGDVTKWDALFKTSLILVFNTLSMKHSKG